MATGSLISEARDGRPSFLQAAAELAGSARGRTSRGFKILAAALAVLALLGIAGTVFRLVESGSDRADWGYYAATLAWMLTVFGGAPMVAIAPMVAKANWVRPVARIATLGAIGTAVTTLLLIPLLFVLPPLVEDGIRRRSIWFDSPVYAPHAWDLLALAGLALAGLALAYVSAIPDLAAIRDHGDGWRQRWGRRLARGFYGTPSQWEWLRMRIGVLGAFYFAMLIFVNFLISTDFAMSLVPGWKDAIFPMYHTLSSLQSGVAFAILGLWAARRWGGMREYIGRDQMWSLGKLLLATSLLWFYFFWSAYIVFWYGRTTADQMTIDLLVTGPYVYGFWAAFTMCFVAPWWVLMWNKVRDSLWGPPVAAVIVLIGMFIDRVRLYVAAWTAAPEPGSLNEKVLTQLPATHWPDVFDVFVMVGAPALAVLLTLLVTRLVPAVSLWEVQQSRLISKPVRFLRGHAVLVGKPD